MKIIAAIVLLYSFVALVFILAICKAASRRPIPPPPNNNAVSHERRRRAEQTHV
jgi:hypothetical protein